MGFRAALQNKAALLTESDRRIGDLLLMSPNEAPFLTASQLAERADVHESTVVRFAQKLGYLGYPELRSDLAADIQRQGEAAVARLRPRDADSSLESLVQQQIETLQQLPGMIPQTSIDAAAGALLTASQVLVIGRGLMTAPGAFLARKLVLLGIPTSTVTQGGGDSVERSSVLREGDVIIVFAFHEEYAGLAPLLVALEAKGVRGILITDQRTLFEPNLPEIVLTVSRQAGVMVSLVVVDYALEYALLSLAPDRSRASWQGIAQLASASRLQHLVNPDDQSQDPERRRPGTTKNGAET